MAENYFGSSDTGRLRDNNEDAFIAEKLSTGLVLACVIDGVGGYEGGEVAAEIARSTILQKTKGTSGGAVETLRNAFLEANRNICNEKAAGKGNNQMACVLTAALVDTAASQFFYAHVGDTRMYLLRDGSLVKVTKDQSFVGFLEDSGRLSEAEAMAHPKRNEINKALGFDAQIDLQEDYIETGSSPFLSGDVLMLCSDGLTDLVAAKDMAAILSASTSLQQKAAALIEAANDAGGKDNITVVLVKNDKKVPRQKATKPVLIKKEAQKVDGAPTTIKTEAAMPKLLEPPSPKQKSIHPAVWAFAALSLLLALGCFWLWTKNKDLQASLPKPAAPQVLNAGEKGLRDSLGLALHTFSFSDTAHKTIVVSDTLFIRQDSLHIKGNGLVLQGDSLFGGPAFVASANNKYLLLENVIFKDFHTALLLQGKGVQLKNVQFLNCRTSVQRNLSLPAQQRLTGLVRDTVVLKKDSLPK